MSFSTAGRPDLAIWEKSVKYYEQVANCSPRFRHTAITLHTQLLTSQGQENDRATHPEYRCMERNHDSVGLEPAHRFLVWQYLLTELVCVALAVT